MGNLSRQTGNELKQLPVMLGKLLGGIMAVVGFGAAVWMGTRNTGTSGDTMMIYLFVGVAGIVIFVMAGRKLSGRKPAANGTQPTQTDKKRTSILAWSLLLIFVTIFLLVVMVFTR